MNKSTIHWIASAVLLLTATSYADNWPAWRGPDATGTAPNSNPPTTWSETENIKWKVKLTGDASDSSPIVWDNKIFFQTAVKTDKTAGGEPAKTTPPSPAAPQGGQPGQRGPGGQRSGGGGGMMGMGSSSPTSVYQFNVVCLDRATGKTVWEKTACEAKPAQGHHADHGFASYSPVTDGKYVWANFGSRGLYCYDFDGNLIWKKDLIPLKTTFGEAGSLTLAGDAVIVVADNDTESWIFAFEKNTGKDIWKKKRDEKTSYATPLALTVDGKMQVVTNATNKIRSYDVKTGEIIWECGGQTQNVIPSPVAGFDMVFCTSGFRGSALQAIKLGKTGDLTGTDAIVWQVKEGTPYVPSPLLHGEHLYVFSVNDGILSCYNAKTGQPYYVKKKIEQIKTIYASPTGAADRVYCVGRDGTTCVLKNSDTFELIATNKLDDGIDNSPAIVGDEIILKGKQYVYCIAKTK